MAEDPEQVLPQQRVGAGGDGEERGVELALERCSSTSATVITGMANSSRNWITRIIHVNTGMRISDMPLVRMLRAVTIRLMAPVWRGDAGDQQAERPDVDAVGRRER